MRFTKFILLFLLFFPSISLASEQEDILKIAVHFNRGQVNIESVEVGKGYVSGDNGVVDTSPIYWLEAVSDTGSVLFKKQFNIQLEIMPEPPLPGEENNVNNMPTQLEETISMIIIPYFLNIKWLNLYGANYNLIEKQDVAYLSQVCGNGICQNSENSNTCPNDCLENRKDGYCSPGLGEKDPDCVKFDENKLIQTNLYLSKYSNGQIIIIFGIFLFLIFILIILVYLFLIKNKKIINIKNNNLIDNSEQNKDIKL